MEANLIISMRMALSSASASEDWHTCMDIIRSMLTLPYMDEDSRLHYQRKLLIYRELATTTSA